MTPKKATTTEVDFDDEGDTMFMPHTKSGHALDECVSALQKAVRRGREREAIYFTREIVDSGFVRFFWRRMMIISAEECSNDLQLCAAVGQLAANAERASKAFTGRVECIIETQAILHLCRAAKSREACDASGVAYHAVQDGFRIEPHPAAVDMHTRRGRAMGRSLRDFRDEGRHVAGARADDPKCQNLYEALLWGERQPYVPRPEEPDGEPDIVFPPAKLPFE